MKKIWYLEDVNLFRTICPHKYNDYKKSHKLHVFSKKEFVYFNEEHANSIYLVNKGKVKIGYYNENGEEIVKAILSKGEVFGIKALLGETIQNEFAQALDKKTSICSVTVEQLQGLMVKNRKLNLKIYTLIGLYVKRLERRIEVLLFKDVKTRVLEFISELESTFGKTLLNGDILIKHPYTQKNMASLLGTSRPSINLVINNLKKEKHIDFQRNRIILKNSLSVSQLTF